MDLNITSLCSAIKSTDCDISGDQSRLVAEPFSPTSSVLFLFNQAAIYVGKTWFS